MDFRSYGIAKTGKLKSNQMPKVPLFTFPNLINWLTFDFDNRLRKRQLAIQTISYKLFIWQKGEVLITLSSQGGQVGKVEK